MICKLLEIRDRGTRIDALAMKFSAESEAERHIIAHGGWGVHSGMWDHYVMLARISGGFEAHADPFDWPSGSASLDPPIHFRRPSGEFTDRPINWVRWPRTLFVAHLWLRDFGGFESLRSGDVLCVGWILGERETPKTPERLEHP